ncbi:glycerol-3-phosphate 1-O-acyltransferase PlsY [Paludisphaera borealis]|uniref:Glycerol-3-phosphate acyltransferase n=1 Tax=Paludisphaera borealis TaxID=1387353 RepID=A0A1U7CW23_9BACT|nr:glycerol-3-phosphate 1-O-acyltransferase PlsY [Paludisphaera borealis]APW63144.1 Glycerol-3-phosphate acyltransferase [Paludisphaera borealis]
MTSFSLTALASYALGSVPFGYIVYYLATRTDVRTVGSGNIGATNVGRLLGFRYFVLVFVLDLLKGLLPTAGLPWLAGWLGLPTPAELPVVAALAAIVGHNFPVYLGFRGGKGVATSLGALLALDPIACAAATIGFFAVFLVTRYVSLSSMTGGVAFVAAYFARTAEPWSREHRAMSLLALAVVGLLILRHRKNIGRLIAGTETKVPLRGRKSGGPPSALPAGKIQPMILLSLAFAAVSIVAGASWLIHRARTPIEVQAGPWNLRETDRESTGQQRSTRVVFNDRGDKLAVMCPRYNRVLVYRIADDFTLELLSKIEVAGRPVAIAAAGDKLVVLLRPANDRKHLEPGWSEVFTFAGSQVGPRILAGYYPDDLSVTPDGRHLLVLCSGRAEGDADKPSPELTVLPADFGSNAPEPLGRVTFESGDDPDRLTVSSGGTRVLVSLAHSKQSIAVDLADLAAPVASGRTDLAADEFPYVSQAPDGDWIVMPTGRESEAVVVSAPHSSASPDYLVLTRPEDSALEIVQVSPRRTLGQFPVKGPFNLGGTETSGLAYCRPRSLLAVTTKPGTIHLIHLESRLDAADQVAATVPVR